MSEQTKTIVPLKRFNEFKGTEEWNSVRLDDLYTFKVTNSLSRDNLNYENGNVKNIHYGDIHTKFSTLFDIQKEKVPFINPSEPLGKIKQDNYCIEGDMLFADASEDLADIGKSIEIVNLSNEKLLSGLHTLLARQKEEKLIIGFGGHLFKSNHIRKQIQKESQGAKVLGISAGRLSAINICYPSEKKEQQKIADCLSSIDECIAAQSNKINKLKDHKKGLMQQLFQREGEAVPKLRFQEFQDAGEWDERTLGDITSKTDRKNKEGISYPVYSINNKVGFIPQAEQFDGVDSNKRGYDITLYKIIEKNTFAYNPARINVGSIGFSGDLNNIIISSLYVCFKSTKNVDDKFLLYFFETSAFKESVNNNVEGGIRSYLFYENFSRINVVLPKKEEQQKIANCLSSIDDLIAIQTQLLETYKVHKKGLMQQLFPAVDEVSE